MTANKFSNALSSIDEKYVDEAVSYTAKRKSNAWIKWASVAACFCLIVVAAFTVSLRFDDLFEQGSAPSGSDDLQNDAPLDNSDNFQSDASGDHSHNSQGGAPSDSDDSSSNYITIGISAADPMSPYAISCEIPAVYSTNNFSIPIVLSFGLIEGCQADTDYYSEIVLTAENDKGDTVVIKSLDIFEILKSEYLIVPEWDERREWITGFNFTNKQSFSLPLSLFSGSSGRIHIVLNECSSPESEDIQVGSGTYIFFDYTRDESSISISSASVG